VSGKILFIAALMLAAGTVLVVPVLPAAPPQYETRQDPTQKEMQERMTRAANKKRQEEIREDTDKLFQLATDLKAAVDKTNENLLSLDVVRKADEVEKLAKKVKEKMKDAVGQPVNTGPVPQRPNPNFPR
jgi:septin family protein